MYIIYCSNGIYDFSSYFPLKAFYSKDMAEVKMKELKSEHHEKRFFIDYIKFNASNAAEVSILSRTSGSHTYAIEAFETKRKARKQLNTVYPDVSGIRIDCVSITKP